MAKSNNANKNVRYVSAKDVKGKNATKKVYQVDKTKPGQKRSSGNYTNSNNSAQDYYFHQARRNSRQYLQNYKPVKTGREYYAEQARKNPRQYLNDYETVSFTPYQSKEEWMAENQNQHTEPRSLLDRIFGVMMNNSAAQVAYAHVTGGDKSDAFIQSLKYMNPFNDDVSGRKYWSDVIREYNKRLPENAQSVESATPLAIGGFKHQNKEEIVNDNFSSAVLGLGLDIFADPITYINPFSAGGKIIKGTGMTLDVAKDVKKVAKAASISGDIEKAKKLETASGKLRDLSMKDVTDYVRKMNPDFTEEQVVRKAEVMHDAFSRKIYGYRNVSDGVKESKTGIKSLDKFRNSLHEKVNLRKLGDNTIAPYYNSLTKKLRSNRVGAAFSKNNEMLRTSNKLGVFEGFKKFYLRDLQKGYERAGKNLKAIDKAGELKKLVDNFDEADVAQFIDDYEKGLYADKFRLEDARLKAEEESLKKLELNDAKRKKIEEVIKQKRAKHEEMKEFVDELAKYLDSDVGKWEYNYATGMLQHYQTKLKDALETFVFRDINEAEQTFARNELRVAESELDESLDTLYEVQQKGEPRIAEAQNIQDTSFESTLTPEELARYNTRDVNLDVATERYEKAKNSSPNDATVDFVETHKKRNEVLEKREDVANAFEKTQKKAANMLEKDGVIKVTDDGFVRTNEFSQPDAMFTTEYSDVTKVDLEALHSGGYSYYDLEQRPTAQTIKYFDEFTSLTPEDKNIVAKQWANIKVKTRKSKMYPEGYATFENTPWWNPEALVDPGSPSVGIKWSTSYVKGEKKLTRSPIGLSPQTGYQYIKIADKKQVVDKINQFMKPFGVQFSVYAITDDIFMDVYASLCCGNYVDAFTGLREVFRRQTAMIDNAKWFDQGYGEVSNYWFKALDVQWDTEKIANYENGVFKTLSSDAVPELENIDKDAYDIVQSILADVSLRAKIGDIDKEFFKEIRKNPLLILEDYDARLSNRGKHYTRQNLRDWKYSEIDETASKYRKKDIREQTEPIDSQVAKLIKQFKENKITEKEYYSKLDEIKKSSVSSGKQIKDRRVSSVYEDTDFSNLEEVNYNPFVDNEVEAMYFQNREWFDSYTQQCYEMYGVAPVNLTNDQAREFLDVIELLDRHLDDAGNVNWNEICNFAKQYEKGLQYQNIESTVRRLMAGEGIIKNTGKGFVVPHRYINGGNGLWYSDVLKNFADEYKLPIKDVLKTFESGDYEKLSQMAYQSKFSPKNDPVLALKEKINAEGYSVDSFKKDFLDMDHYEKVALLYAFGDVKAEKALETIEEIANFDKEFKAAVKRIEQYNLKNNKGHVIFDRPLEGLTEYEKEVYGIYYYKKFKEMVDSLPRSEANTLNEVGQKFWKRKLFKEEMALKRETFELSRIEKRHRIVENPRKSFEYMKKKAGFTGDIAEDLEKQDAIIKDFTMAKAMSDVDVKLETVLIWERGNELYSYIYKTAGYEKISRREVEELQKVTDDVRDAIKEYRDLLTSELKKGRTDSIQLTKSMAKIKALVNRHTELAKSINFKPLFDPEQSRLVAKKFEEVRLANAESKRLLGIERRVNNLSEENFYKMLEDYYDNPTVKFEEQVAKYDELSDIAESQRDAIERYDNWISKLDSKAENLKEESKLDDMMLRLAGQEPSDDVRLALLHLENEKAFKTEIETRAASHAKQIKNARKREKYWRDKIDKLVDDVDNKTLTYKQAKRTLDELVVEGSKIPTISHEDVQFLQQKVKRFLDDIELFEADKMAIKAGEKEMKEIEHTIFLLNRELGDITLSDIFSTVTDTSVAHSIGISNDLLNKLDKLTGEDQMAVARILSENMSKIRSDEFAFGLLSERQAKSHRGGETYFPHVLSDEAKEFLGLLFKDEAGKFSPEHGPKAKWFTRERTFPTIKEGEDYYREQFHGNFYNKDIVDVFLIRNIKSNELIHSTKVNNAIKSVCIPYTGTKTSDHIVASYIDVQTGLYAGYKEQMKSAISSGAEYTKTFDEYLDEALQKAGIDKNLYSANYAYFDVLPEQFDLLKRYFPEKNEINLFNMDNDIFYEVNKFTKLQMESMQSGLMKVFDKFQRGWKITNSYINPGFHIQNAISNAFASFMGIGADAINPARLKKTIQILRTRDPRQITKLGGKEYTFKQLCDIVEQYGIIDNMFFNKDIANHIDAAYNFPLIKLGNKLGAGIEGYQRVHLFFSALDQGKSFEEAAEMVDKFLFDYADLTHFEQTVMKRIIPFYTFMRKNLPLQLEMMIEKPHVYSTIQKTFVELGKAGGSENYIEENERNPYRQGDIQLPFEINGRYYGIADQLPYTQLERILDWQKLLGQTSPVLKTPVEALANTFLYTGMPITGDDGEMNWLGEGSLKDRFYTSDLINYMAQQVPYAKMFENADKSGKDVEDMKTRRNAYILGQFLGFPINSIDRMYWYDDYGNWAAERYDKSLPQSIRDNMELRRNN